MSQTANFRAELSALIPRMRRFCRALTANAADADDLVQDTLERALTRQEQWRAGTRLDSWVFRIAQNLWIDRTRSRRVRGEVSDEETLLAVPGIDGRTASMARHHLRTIAEAMAAMSEEHRVVIGLVLIEGYSYREAADILGLPEGTITSRLFRARSALERSLNEGASP